MILQVNPQSESSNVTKVLDFNVAEGSGAIPGTLKPIEEKLPSQGLTQPDSPRSNQPLDEDIDAGNIDGEIDDDIEPILANSESVEIQI